MKIELEAFRSKTGEIIIIDEIYDLAPKFFISPSVSHRRAKMRYRHMTDDIPNGQFEKDTLTIVFNGDIQAPSKTNTVPHSGIILPGQSKQTTPQAQGLYRPLPENEDESKFQHTSILYNNHAYNRIECPNQIKEMMVGSDPDACILAYDLLKYHSQELTGFIRI